MADADYGAALGRIAEKLRRAKAEDRRPFAFESHKFDLRPPLPEADAAAFEARHGVTLPEEYRAFVTTLGEGGAGPIYGMLTLEGGLEEARGDEGDDFLRTPFPRTGSYNPYEDPQFLDLRRRVDAGEVAIDDEEPEQERLGLFKTTGTLALSHEGCGTVHFLVVSGPERGGVWVDAQASDAGLIKLGVGFLEWYERWLDDVLAGGDGTFWFGDEGD